MNILSLFRRCYYALQGIHDERFETSDITQGVSPAQLVSCKSDSEKERERLTWRKYLGKILPASFRIGKDVPEYYKETLTAELHNLLQKAQQYVPPPDDQDDDAVVDDSTDRANMKLLCDPRAGPLKDSATQIQALSFCPYAYQLSGLDRATIRKNPALEELHLWLKQQVAAGTITRQETVSMIPTTLLNVTSTDMVLDMCAAPGSKTSQMLEDLQCNIMATAGETECQDDTSNNEALKSSSRSTPKLGCLVANDASTSRACMLVSQLRRILHMHPVALITAVQAQYFPSDIVQFDKILCDVPCSGDGTTRKNINVWKTWSASGALALHTLQLSIATKGAAQLLKTNGMMVYSTCSLNPIENEAVVAELLRQSKGALELVDCQPLDEMDTSEHGFTNGPLLGFHTRPGRSTWKVLCEDMTQRQLKNREKKNNAKMRKRREAYEMDATKDATLGEPEENLKNKETDPCIKTINDEANGDDEIPEVAPVEESIERPAAPVQRFAPTSWDETELLRLANSEGLIHYTSMEEVPDNLNRRIRKSAFPPTAEEVQQFHLERCIRCLPQDNNTGGFFVALLRKVAPYSASDRRHHRTSKEAADAIGSNLTNNDTVSNLNVEAHQIDVDSTSRDARKRPRNGDSDNVDVDTHPEEDEDDDEVDYEAMEGLDADNLPVRRSSRGEATSNRGLKNPSTGDGDDFGKDDFAAVRDDIMEPLIEHYGLSNGFDKALYMARACSESKVIYYVGKAVKQLFDLGIQKRVTIVNTGLKGFTRNNRNVADCAVTYRVCQEGVHFLVPYMTKRKYVVCRDDFRACLQGDGKTIHLSKFTDEFRNQVKEESTGSFVVILKGYEDKMDQKLLVCMWKCRGESIDSLVAKVEVDGLLGKLDAMESGV